VGLLLAAGLLTRVRWMTLLKRLLWLEPFVLGVAVLALFQPGGWRLALVLLGKSSLCLLAMILLSATTPMSDLLEAMRRARVPGLFITTIALTYRYLFVLRDESQRMQRARLSRSFAPGKGRTWRNLGNVAGQLFVRCSERAERIYGAMCARGWR
jgi:cobalt/nickel transport system permease protein